MNLQEIRAFRFKVDRGEKPYDTKDELLLDMWDENRKAIETKLLEEYGLRVLAFDIMNDYRNEWYLILEVMKK